MKKLMCVLCALLIALTFAGCSAGDGSASAGDTDTGMKSSYDDIGSISSDNAISESVDYDESGSSVRTDRKLIYNSYISAETKEFDKAKDALDVLVAECGGYIESSDVSGYSYDEFKERRYLDYGVRVPSDKLDAFLDQLGELVNITSNTKDMNDVTDSYVDTEARLNALKAEEARLLELLEQAETLDDVILLEDKVSEVRYEIESLTSMLKTYDKEIAYSFVSIHLTDVTEYSEDSSFGSRIGEAFVMGWTNFAQVLEDIVIVLVAGFPFLLLLGGVIVLIVWMVRKSNKKQKEKLAQFAAMNPPVTQDSGNGPKFTRR